MPNKVLLYCSTLRNVKLSQIYSRIKIRMGGSCGIGVRVNENHAETVDLPTIPELDFDPVFIERFPADELMSDRITILHSLFSLVKAWKDSGEKKYLEKTFEIISGWINCNPTGEKPAWTSYPTSLRIVNWISYFGYTAESMPDEFKKTFLDSLHRQ